MEDAGGQLLVNEVNHTPEFHGAMSATEADVPARIVDYLLKIAREGS
jgi:[lysine-biosynthesis-protein LysW]--L-2-aminoadipate ligase